jgi:hypothetical protein
VEFAQQLALDGRVERLTGRKAIETKRELEEVERTESDGAASIERKDASVRRLGR